MFGDAYIVFRGYLVHLLGFLGVFFGGFECFNCVYVVFNFFSGEFLYGIFWRVQGF